MPKIGDTKKQRIRSPQQPARVPGRVQRSTSCVLQWMDQILRVNLLLFGYISLCLHRWNKFISEKSIQFMSVQIFRILNSPKKIEHVKCAKIKYHSQSDWLIYFFSSWPPWLWPLLLALCPPPVSSLVPCALFEEPLSESYFNVKGNNSSQKLKSQKSKT